MEKDLQNIIEFTGGCSNPHYYANLDGSIKTYCDMGVPFDKTDLKLVSMGNPSDGYYISTTLPIGTTAIIALVKYDDLTTETIAISYDNNAKTITNFLRNDIKSILIKIS